MSWPFCKNWCYTTTASTTHSTHDVNYFFSVWAETFFKACFLKKDLYNSRIGISRLYRFIIRNGITPEHNFGIIKNSVTWCAYLKMSKLGDIPHYDGAGHKYKTIQHMKLLHWVINNWFNFALHQRSVCGNNFTGDSGGIRTHDLLLTSADVLPSWPPSLPDDDWLAIIR